MNHHAGGLVDNGEVRIFKDHVEGYVFCDGAERRGTGLTSNVDPLTTAEFERGLGPCAIDQNVALFQKELHAGAADAVELGGQEGVNALAGGFVGHGDGAQFTHG